MSRQRKPSRHASVDEQIQVVLAVLKGELSLAEAARRHGVTSATVGNWRDWDAGTHLLAAARAQPLREAAEGPWPSPKVDQIEAVAAKYAAERPAWGHRKIAAMMRADGYQVSTSTVERALRRRGLLLPSGFRADRRSWSRLRKRVFRDPPRERNLVWQMDFSEFETTRGGIWRICSVIDYATKYCLAATVTATSRGQDALACLRRAVAEAERVLTSTTSAPTAG